MLSPYGQYQQGCKIMGMKWVVLTVRLRNQCFHYQETVSSSTMT